MKELTVLSFSDSSLHKTGVLPLSGGNKITIHFSHWVGDVLDMDLEVSYDGGNTWVYGGGCLGARSEENGIEFHFTYPGDPTHLQGSFRSEKGITSTVRIFSGD